MKFVNTDQQITHLLEKGADPNMYDKREDPPLLKSLYRNPILTLTLLQAGADTTAKSVIGRSFYDLFMERVFYDNSLSCLGEEFASEIPTITETSQEKVDVEIRQIPSKSTFRKIKLFLTNLKVPHKITTMEANAMTVTFQDNLTCWKTLRMLEQFPLVYTVRTLRDNEKQSVWLDIKKKLDQQRWIDSDDESNSSKIKQCNAACEAIQSTISMGNYDINCRTSNGVLPLCLAVKIGSLPLIQFLLEMEVNPNLTDGMEETPLYLAVQNGQIEILQLLLDAKADVNYPKESGTNEPLICRILDLTSFLSSMESRISLAELLIQHDADVNPCKGGIDSPLIKAVDIRSDEIVEKLLKHGSNVNHPGKYMATALHFCCMERTDIIQEYSPSSEVDSRILRKLLESGASVNHQTYKGDTPVHIAIIRRHSYMTLQMISKTFEVNTQNVRGVTCLMLAARWDQEMSRDVVKALLKEGADVALKDEKGNTALHYLGCEGPVMSLLDVFLDSGANINFANNDGYSPLNTMVKNRKNLSKEDVEYMLSKDADPNYCSNGCESPLTNALLRGETDIAEILVAAGANVNHMSESGLTALTVALSYSTKKKDQPRSSGKTFNPITIVKWLLDAGANPNMLNLQRESHIFTLMKSPFTNNTVSVLSTLLEHNANPNLGLDNPLCSAAEVSLEAVQLLLSAHVEVNKPDKDGNTALVKCLESEICWDNNKMIWNVQRSNKGEATEIVQCLIENKANVNIVGKSGLYPIEIAIKRENILGTYTLDDRIPRKLPVKGDLISLLLNAGAELNKRKTGEDSPLHLAVCQNCPGIAQLLISKGADVNHVGVGNITPLHRCLEFKRTGDEYQTLPIKMRTSHLRNFEDRLEKRTTKVDDTLIDAFRAKMANSYMYIEDVNGTTPLESNMECFRMLLAAGADPLLKGNNLYEKCSEMEDLRFLNVLLEVMGSDQVSNSLFHKVWENLNTSAIKKENRDVLGNTFSMMLTSTNTIHVNIKNQFEDIPLIFFCGENDVNVVEKLLQRGASVNMVDGNGLTALHRLFQSPDSKDKSRILCMLLERNANVNAKDRYGKTLFQKVYSQYRNEDYDWTYFYNRGMYDHQWLKELIKGGARYEENSLTSLLSLASENQHFDLMTVLIDHGADLSVTKNGAGIMHRCWSSDTQKDIRIGFTEPLKYLVKSGVSINQSNARGETPLFLLVSKKENSSELDMVEYLLQNGADPNQNSNNCNVLKKAIEMKKTKTISLLLANGAEVNVLGNESTACCLLKACNLEEVSKRNAISSLLLQHGCSINSTNRLGDTALSKLTERITQYGDNITITTEDSKTFAEIDLTLFNQLVCGGADLTPRRYKDSLLVVLTRNGLFGAASNLVNCGYDFKRDQLFQNHDLVNQNFQEFKNGLKTYKRVGYKTEKREFLKLLEEYQANSVPSLSSLCRTMTRRHLVDISRGAEIESKINQLPLPTKIKKYLTCRENIHNMERQEVSEIEESSRTLNYRLFMWPVNYFAVPEHTVYLDIEV